MTAESFIVQKVYILSTTKSDYIEKDFFDTEEERDAEYTKWLRADVNCKPRYSMFKSEKYGFFDEDGEFCELSFDRISTIEYL